MVLYTSGVQRRMDIAIAVSLSGLALVLYHEILTLYWLYDDPYHFQLVDTPHIWDILFSRQFWDSFVSKMFTPLLFVSYELDLSLFGYQSRFFYVHQLMSIVVATLALYLVVRLWLKPFSAGIASAVFVMGVPFAEWAHLVMTRHYLDGLTLSALSTALYVLASRQKSVSVSQKLAVISAGFYLLSSLAKEIYVVLPLLLMILPERDRRPRIMLLLPHAIALAIYLLWRYAMLGTLLGGYGWSVRGDDWAELIAGLPAKFWGVMFGVAPVAGAIILLIFIAAVVALTIRSRAALGRIAWAAVLAIAPIVPVSTVLERRYAVLLWLLIVVVIACACQQFLDGKITPDRVRARAARAPGLAGYRSALVVALVLAIVTGASIRLYAAERARTIPLLERMSAEGRALVRMGEGDVLRHPAIPPAALNGLRMLGERSLGARAGVRWFYDDIQICAPSGVGDGMPYQARAVSPQERFWQFNETTGEIESVTASIPAIASSHCSSIRWDVPLQGEFTMEDGALQWTLGPYQRGTYSFILDNGTQKYEMPREGGFRLGPVETLPMRLRYDSPEGWTTYSPELVLDFRGDGGDEWRRE